MIRILAIDGGGIKGIIPLTFLSALEEKLGNKPLIDKFHLVAGTSTGGIIALGMSSGVPVNQMKDMFLNRGGEIFSRGDSWYSRAFRWVTSVKGTVRSTYATEPMERVFRELVGDKKQSDLSIPTLVASYDLKGMEPFFFQSWRAIDPDEKKLDFSLVDMARATSAGPTYFDPKEVSIGGNDYVFIDGGVTANDPGTCAYAAARKIFKVFHPLKEGEKNRKPRGIQVLSLGTGAYRSELKPWNGGLVSFGLPLVTEVMLGGNQLVSKYQMTNIFRATQAVDDEGHVDVGKRDYTRVNPKLENEKLSKMDDYGNVLKLQEKAQDYLKTDQGQQDLEKWVKFLEEDRVPLKELYFKESLRKVAKN